MIQRGVLICEQLKRCGVETVLWLPDSETRFLHRALLDDREIELLPVCSEGEALAICAGMHVGGKRASVLIENNGLFEAGNALRWVKDSQLPLVFLVGYLSYHLMTPGPRGRIWNDDYWGGVRDLTEPFIESFELSHHLIDSDADVAKVPAAFAEAERTSQPVILLVTSADGYVAGT